MERDNYKRPEDQYKEPKAREMIKQLIESQRKPACAKSTVKSYKAIPFSGVGHAGTLVHICKLDRGHTGMCKCSEGCDVEFYGLG